MVAVHEALIALVHYHPQSPLRTSINISENQSGLEATVTGHLIEGIVLSLTHSHIENC